MTAREPFAGGRFDPRTSSRQPRRDVGLQGLEEFLAAIRYVESGSYEGNYRLQGRAIRGAVPVGAYQILDSYWDAWSRQAGIPGADWRDPKAQDRVASVRAQRYKDAYGTWDLSAAAWIGGTQSVRKIVQRGYTGKDSIQSPLIADYVGMFQAALKHVPEFTFERASAPPKQFLKSPGSSGGWVFPVAGPNEWSGGSWMPNTLTHRGRTHAAIDIYADRGTPIVSPVSGKVLATTRSNIGGFTARIQGDDGLIYYFAHMNEAAVVGAGQTIMAGTHIGFVGNSGSASSTKEHLHLSIKKRGGDAVNPMSFLSGAESSAGIYGGASSQAYGSAAMNTPSAISRMNDMLGALSDKVAGGTRPGISDIGNVVIEGALLGEGDGHVASNQTDVPSTSKEQIDKNIFTENPEVP